VPDSAACCSASRRPSDTPRLALRRVAFQIEVFQTRRDQEIEIERSAEREAGGPERQRVISGNNSHSPDASRESAAARSKTSRPPSTGSGAA